MSNCIYCGNDDPDEFSWLPDNDGDDMLWCTVCNQVVGWGCEACNGEGWVYEDDYECDWINNGHDLITCPECDGDGFYWKTQIDAGFPATAPEEEE